MRSNLAAAEKESQEKTQQFAQEEKCIRDENKRLQRKLQLEVERREALSRHLSESESSLEFEDERLFNENVSAFASQRPISPGGLTRCIACGQFVSRRASERFIKPAIPIGLNTSAPNVLSSHAPSSGGGQQPGCVGGSGHLFPLLGGSGAGGGASVTSLNSSIGSSSNNTSSNISFNSGGGGVVGHTATTTSFVQPASPMDTSMCKD